MRNGDTGINVTQLQRQLRQAGLAIVADGWFGQETEQAVIAFQHRAGLVADGIAGPKTLQALVTRDRNPRHLSEQDLEKAADRLAIPLAALKAINTVESNGAGFLPDGRPVILYERHIAHRLLSETGIEPAELDALVARYPNLINPARGGYAGGPAEWSRLASACQVIPYDIAYAACSWGQYQIMGYHWQRLGYASPEAFVGAMHTGERAHLDAFTRYIEADPALHKAIKAKKWPEVARLYNGPAYKANLYDIKLARAYDRYAAEPEKAEA
jgi:hypothetical protein